MHAAAASFVALLLALAPAAAADVPAHGRAWELVTPGDGNGTIVIAGRAWSGDGNRLIYANLGPQPGAPAGDFVAHSLATRTPHGWSTESVGYPFTAPSPDLEWPQALGVSPDLSEWLWGSPYPLLPGAPAEPAIGVYRRASDGSLTLLGIGGERSGGLLFLGASDDLGHVAFQTQTRLLPADAGRTAGSAAYELAGSTLRLVGVDDAGVPFSACGSMIGDGGWGSMRPQNPVSRDGSRIFFSAPTLFSQCGEPSRVFVREDGEDTTEIAASRCARPDCNAPQAATFAGATPDGGRAFVLTGQQLIDSDVDEGVDLYRRDLSDDSLTRLSTGPSGVVANVNQAGVRIADDGERVYFVASGALVPGMGQEGSSNLYVSDHGTLRLVASGALDLSTASITGDGGTLIFTTATALLPSDLDSSVDVYRYDAEGGGLAHVSAGSAGRGNEPLAAGPAPVTLEPFRGQPLRYLSADGERVLFVTSEALVPEDRNDSVDVYEWAGGVVGLISSGTGDASHSLEYAGVSADGRSVFFITEESLLAADDDGGDSDLYVARLGGGFPDPAAPGSPCSEDACQGSAAARSGSPRPDSLADAEAPARRFGPRPVSAQARRRLVGTGRILLAVDVPAAGRLDLIVRAPVAGPRSRRSAVVARARAIVRRPGVAKLPLRLSRAARRTLKARGSLTLTLAVRHSTLGAARPVRIALKAAAQRPRGGRSR